MKYSLFFFFSFSVFGQLYSQLTMSQFNESGNLSEIEFEIDLDGRFVNKITNKPASGLFIYVASDEQLLIKILQIDSGVIDGPGVTYVDRELFSVMNMNNSKEEGDFLRFYNNGNLKSKERRSDGLKEGPYASYSTTGYVDTEGSVKNGELHGSVRSYYEDGSLLNTGNMQDGVPHGIFREFYQVDGKMKKEVYMMYGHAVPNSTKCWNEFGDEITCPEEKSHID